jgi:signal transduction histidine kinase
VESTHLGWRALAKRQWPLACALLLFLVTEAAGGADSSAGLRQAWQFPGAVVACTLAVLSPRRPLDAALAAACSVVASSVVLRVVQVGAALPVFSGVTGSEMAALMAIVAIAVRQSRPWHGVIATLVAIASVAMSEWLRPNYYVQNYPAFDKSGIDVPAYLVGGGLLLALSVGTGLYFRVRDRERTRAVEAEVTAAQHAERMALARELHDVVAHYVTGIVVHAQAAQAVIAMNPDAAREVLPVIANSGNEALTAMRRLVGTLRGSEPAGASFASTSATSDLADDVRVVAEQSGQPVRLDLDLSEPVPPELGRSVLRLVQESLTNTRKHAEGVALVDVSVSVARGTVRVRVADDGRGQRQTPIGGSGGFGLVGMRERVELLGGQFSAGERSGGGWEVLAELPISESGRC